MPNQAAIFVTFVGIIAAFLSGSFYQVPEGFVGVTYRSGALLTSKGLADPGLHFKMPFIDEVKNIEIRLQTDSVENIPCGTNSGTMIYFEKIEVVNQLRRSDVLKVVKDFSYDYDQILIYQKIHALLSEQCSKKSLQTIAIDEFDKIDDFLLESLQKESDKFTGGAVVIHSVRMTKPRLPIAVKNAFEQKDAEKANLKLAQERAKTAELEARTVATQRKIQAETEKDIKRIAIEKEIMEREGEQKKIAIDDAIFLATEKAKADAALYQAQKEAESNKALLTREYVQLESIKAMNHNTKYYFGEKIPSNFFSNQIADQQKSMFGEEDNNKGNKKK